MCKHTRVYHGPGRKPDHTIHCRQPQCMQGAGIMVPATAFVVLMCGQPHCTHTRPDRCNLHHAICRIPYCSTMQSAVNILQNSRQDCSFTAAAAGEITSQTNDLHAEDLQCVLAVNAKS